MSTMTPKVVMFNIAIGDNTKHVEAGDSEGTIKLEDMIRELSGKFFGFLHKKDKDNVNHKYDKTLRCCRCYNSILEILKPQTLKIWTIKKSKK